MWIGYPARRADVRVTKEAFETRMNRARSGVGRRVCAGVGVEEVGGWDGHPLPRASTPPPLSAPLLLFQKSQIRRGDK